VVSFIFLIFGYFSLLIESTLYFFDYSNFLHIDLIPALINWYALNENNWKGSFFIAFLATLASLFSILPFTAFLLAYILAFWIITYIKINLLELNKIQIHFFTFFISTEIQVVLLLWSGRPELLWPNGMIQGLINMALSPVVFLILNKLNLLLNIIIKQKDETG